MACPKDNIPTQASQNKGMVVYALPTTGVLPTQNIPTAPSEHGGAMEAERGASGSAHNAGEVSQHYNNRLETFRLWPYGSVQSPRILANAGFYYTGIEDRISCYRCKKTFFNWERDDDPWEQHVKWSPDCEYIKQNKERQPNVVDQIVVEQNHPVDPNPGKTEHETTEHITVEVEHSRDVEHAAWLMEQLVITPRVGDQTPRHVDYMDGNIRQSTFRNWPIPDIQPTARLAAAGFFYKGVGDQVTCYHCGYTLHNWEEGDDPWEEHVKWSPRCSLVLKRQEEQTGGATGVTVRTENTQQEVPTVEQSSTVSSSAQGLTENKTNDDSKLCKICMSEDINVVFLPCGHLVCCVDCANRVSHCPICRKFIRGTVKAYWG